jgi:hypothetical protein
VISPITRQISLRAPFVNNRVDPALMSKAGLSVASRLPKPLDQCGRVIVGQRQAPNEWESVGRIDIPKLLGVSQPFEMIQLPKRMLMFFEHLRTIWLDGRKLPEDPDPVWMGYSVGIWEATLSSSNPADLTIYPG